MSKWFKLNFQTHRERESKMKMKMKLKKRASEREKNDNKKTNQMKIDTFPVISERVGVLRPMSKSTSDF